MMSQLKIGLKLPSTNLPLKRLLPIVKQIGVDAIEIDARGDFSPKKLTETGIRQIRKWLDDFGLRVSAVGFQTRRGYDVVEDLQRRIDATKRAMDLAYRLGTNTVVNQVGRIPDDSSDPNWQVLIDSLSELGRYGQKAGAFLAMRTGTDSGERMAALIDALPEGSVGVAFDPGALIINGFSADEAVSSLARHILYVYATDAVRDLAQGRGLAVQLGRGTVDFPQLLGILDQAGYHGYITVDRPDSSQPLEDSAAAVQYLRNIST